MKISCLSIRINNLGKERTYKMYSQTPESYSLKTNPEEFQRIYSEIADATPTKEGWKIRDLIGRLPSIDFYAESTQGDIIRVVVRDIRNLPDNHDRLYNSRARYKWLFAPRG